MYPPGDAALYPCRALVLHPVLVPHPGRHVRLQRDSRSFSRTVGQGQKISWQIRFFAHEIMLHKLEYQSRKLRKQPDHRAYVDNLLEIYNFKSRGPALTIDGATIRNAGQELA